MTLVLAGGSVVTTLDPPTVASDEIVIRDGRVASVGVKGPDGGARIDCSGCLVIPGNVCGHHHLCSALARGMLEYDPPTPLTTENLAGDWAFGLSARHVRDVVVNGEIVVRNRELTRMPEAGLRGRCREFGELLWRRMDELEAHPFEPAGGA